MGVILKHWLIPPILAKMPKFGVLPALPSQRRGYFVLQNLYEEIKAVPAARKINKPFSSAHLRIGDVAVHQ